MTNNRNLISLGEMELNASGNNTAYDRSLNQKYADTDYFPQLTPPPQTHEVKHDCFHRTLPAKSKKILIFILTYSEYCLIDEQRSGKCY